MKKLYFISILAFSILCFASCKTKTKQEATDKEIFGAAPVKVILIQKQDLSQNASFTALIEPVKKIDITPDIGGKIAHIYVNEGDKVQKGQTLAELDTRTIRLQLEQAKASLAVATANVNDARKNRERMARLSKENAISDQQFEKAKLVYEAAQAQLQQAHAGLNLVRHQLNISIMKAPFSGIISSKNNNVGDVINPMMGGVGPGNGVLTLMDFSRVKMVVEMALKDIIYIKKGQPARLKVSAFPEKEFFGKVNIVNRAADPMTKKFRVEIISDNPDLVLRPNTYGEVQIELQSRKKVIVIPYKALINQQFVFVALNNQAIKKQVEIGLQTNEFVEIISGINEGDKVISEGNFGLKDNAKIYIQEDNQ